MKAGAQYIIKPKIINMVYGMPAFFFPSFIWKNITFHDPHNSIRAMQTEINPSGKIIELIKIIN
jgi:hypothetical protein